ncbi:MAG: alkaline phosphatase PhoX [Phycisphaerae bacterium]|jgi:hypothetical protein
MQRFMIVALVAAAGIAAPALAQGTVTGPNAGATPYMLPASNSSGVQFVSIATTGASLFYTNLDTGVQNYRHVGIPDGLGIYRDADDIANNTFSVVQNHELGASDGIVRAHGSTGAFVSQWKIRRSDFGVVGGRDLIQGVNQFNTTTNSFFSATTQFGRFCSADLAAQSAYKWMDPTTGTVYGTDNRILLNGEEIGNEGRAFANIIDGPEARQSYQLPDLARFSWENAVSNPFAQRKTIVAGTDDSTPGQVYFYVGDKQATGNTIERAGLMNGKTYGMRVPGIAFEGAAPINSSFTMVDKSATQRGTGAAFQQSSRDLGVTEFARPEDSAWNPSNPSQLIWVNTGGTVNGVSVPTRIYSATFSDVSNPEAGGMITMLGQGNDFSSFGGGVTSFTGTTTANSFDNIAISRFNQVLIQEDVGNNARLGRLWMYDLVSDSMIEIGISDSARFLSGGSEFLTQDEETSGIVDAWDTIGPGWWLMNMQAQNTLGGELVRGGQMMAVFIPQTVPTPGAIAVLGLGGLMAARRRRSV